MSDAELVALFLQTGTQGCNVMDLAHQLLNEFGSLSLFVSASKQQFLAAKGLGKAKFGQLQAMKEMISRHYLASLHDQPVFENVNHTRTFLLSQMRDERDEVLAVMFLNNQHQLISFKKLFFGTINAASVYPRVIVRHGLELNAAALILVHNHPSGVAEPSMADKSITRQITDAAKLMDIAVIDHFVIGAGYSVSFAERGLI